MVSRYALISAVLPDKVNAPVPEPTTVTLPLLEAAKVPAEAVKVTVRLSPSASANVTEDKSTLEAVCSVTVISEGAPATVGASLTAVISRLTAVVLESTVPSFALRLNVAALSPLAFSAPVY